MMIHSTVDYPSKDPLATARLYFHAVGICSMRKASHDPVGEKIL